jgi:hypothetical protein
MMTLSFEVGLIDSNPLRLGGSNWYARGANSPAL